MVESEDDDWRSLLAPELVPCVSVELAEDEVLVDDLHAQRSV